MSRFKQLQHRLLGIAFDESNAWWQVNIMCPLGYVLYFAAVAPIGWRMLMGDASVRSADADVAG